MLRKDFIKSCGFACMGGAVAALFLESCASQKNVTGQLADEVLQVPLTAFYEQKNGQKLYKKHIIVNHNALQYPIAIFRLSADDYSALWMSCTHQGAELQLFGDKLECPAHGSTFDNRGQVENGPAAQHLRTFPVSLEGNLIKISLKK